MAPIKLSTFDPVKKKKVFVGLFKDKTFYKICKPEHFMIKYNGYGIQTNVISKLKELGCTNICFDIHNKEKLYIPFRLYADSKPRYQGHGYQNFVDIKLATKKPTKKGLFGI